MTVTPFDVASVLIVLAATLSYLNHRFLGLPQTVGLTIMGAVASLVIVMFDRLFPESGVGARVISFISAIDFRATLMDGMLSFLLFAGALHVDWHEMRRGRWPILVLSTIGVLISTVLVGGGFYVVTSALGLALPFLWFLVLGALISPTDPVAVMGILKRANVSPMLEATVAGESLFNDGVGVVVFSIVLALALSNETFSPAGAIEMFMAEAGGGVLLGALIGWIAFHAMRSIDEYKIEVMISLAVVMGGYTIASWAHVSGPVAMAVAGLLLGNRGVAEAMSETTKDYLLKFWALIDETLNAVLFLLIGLELVAIPSTPQLIVAGLIGIPLALAARAISVMLPLLAMKPFLSLGQSASTILIWGGLRGGISVALALGLPDGPARSSVLTATYLIVLFSVVIQGGTIEKVIAWRSSRGRDW